MSLYKKNIFLGCFSAAMLGLSSSALAAEEMDHSKHDMSGMDHGQHDSTAGQHVHHGHGKGGFMFEYQFMRMEMDGLLDGTDSVNTRDISGATMGMPPTNNMMTPYMMSPTAMTMDMHMFMGMYGFTDSFTLMGMINYLSNDMDMVMHMYTPTNVFAGDMTGAMDTSGIGDTRFDGMFKLTNSWTGSVGLSIPTGSIDEKITMTMAGTNILNGMPMMVTNGPMQAPYMMQLGSGTYDLIPSVTYQKGSGNWNWGGQASYTYHIGENDNDYTLGDIFEINGWGRYSVNKGLSLSGRLEILDWGKIDGQDPLINPMMSPAGDPNATGGTRADLLFGISGHFAEYHMISAEVGAPIFQDLNGPQLETDLIYSISYQYMMM